MRRAPLKFFLPVLAVALAAGWMLLRREPAAVPHPTAQVATPSPAPAANPVRLLSAPPASLLLPSAPAAAVAAGPDSLRLANTDESFESLCGREDAILLANALIDTRRPLALAIPAHLRSVGPPVAAIVQARGPVTPAFCAVLAKAGAATVSYLPHNAFLVQASGAALQTLSSSPEVQAVVPWEPYFKLSGNLLQQAVSAPDTAPGGTLALTMFEGMREKTLAAIAQAGAQVLAEEQAPFGPLAIVRAPIGSLAALARLPGVQAIETVTPRVPANDLSRPRMGVSGDPVATTNYLGLTGSNVMVAVVDTGVDATHPDLKPRVFGTATNDTDGHGTFVAGTIASSGRNGPAGTNASGSMNGANFRGIAPGSKILSLDPPPLATEAMTQQEVARSNVFISNNSWSYERTEYTVNSASYDAATRDALPGRPGSQPVLFVFPAGNAGAGNESGSGGVPGTILAPGTAKNVLTVGSVEQLRNVTNKVVIDGATNAIFLPGSDTDGEVASYSGRGNVGISVEGRFGRFKPDVVAPGSWVVSCSSSQWDTNAYYHPTNVSSVTYDKLLLRTNEVWNDSIYLPENAVGFGIFITRNEDTPVPMPRLPIFVRRDDIPEFPAGVYDFVRTNQVRVPPDTTLSPVASTWYYSVANILTQSVNVNVTKVVYTTNDLGDMMEVIRGLNDKLDAPYRYLSGTSVSVGKVSGFLALLQEYFEQTLKLTNSPALMKALVINGARSLGQPYSFDTRSTVNYQGWGLVNLPTTLPSGLSTNAATPGSLLFFEQEPTNALSTGFSQTRTLKLATNATTRSLRATLVWTDPPGNPAASLKLVNNLDLIITNLDSGAVYFGNTIPSDSVFSAPWPTNELPVYDSVNNVENIFIGPPLGTNYSVTVFARRVNVNTVTAITNNTVQDYALVLSCGDGVITNAITLVTPTASVISNIAPRVVHLPGQSNGIPIFAQTAGASSPLQSTNLLTNAISYGVISLGVTNQWTFFVVTNNTSYTNAAFRTFLPHTLALPRMGVFSQDETNQTRPQADIDLYVSRDANLTNLVPAAVTAAQKSLSRGGMELILYSNAVANETFYVGVKSESQMAALYAFEAIFSELPFGLPGPDGFVHGPATLIPDGSPDNPQAANIFLPTAESGIIRRVLVKLSIEHENLGDLLSELTYNGGQGVTLQNHTYGMTITTLDAIYDESGQGDFPAAVAPDGPGSLTQYMGVEAAAQWDLFVIDNAMLHTGQVLDAGIKVEVMPEEDTSGAFNICLTNFAGNAWWQGVAIIPANATNLLVEIGYNSGPLQIFMRQDGPPTLSTYDRKADVLLSGGSLSWSIYDSPPLPIGKVYFAIYNPGSSPVNVCFGYRIGRSLVNRPPVVPNSLTFVPILDDAVTYGTLSVTNTNTIVSVEAGIRIDHPRVSDLAITLISPRGTRVLLSENRGYDSTNGFGTDILTTNVIPVDSTGGFEAYTNVVDTGTNSGTFTVAWDFYGIPDHLRAYYDGALIFDTGMTNGAGFASVNYGPGVATEIIITVNEGGNPNENTLWEYTLTTTRRQAGYAVFTEDTARTRTPIKFALPPFSITNQTRLLSFENFQATPAGIYSNGAAVGLWMVTSNSVEVLADTNAGSAAGQVLSLGQGAVSTRISTQPGQTYTVTFAYRLGPAFDLNGSFETPPGGTTTNDVYVAGQSFGGWGVFSGAVKHLAGPGYGAAQGSSFVDLNGPAANPVPGSLFRTVGTVPGQSYRLGFAYAGNSAGPPTVKRMEVNWNGSVPLSLTFDTAGHSNAVPGWIYTNIAVTAAGADRLAFTSLTPASAFGPWLDDVTLSPLGAAAVLGQGAELGRVTGQGEWKTNSFNITASATSLTFEIASLSDGLWIDDLKVTTVEKDVYYLPEVSLNAFSGQRAYGEWQLELWDSRVGATNPTPMLRSWELRFIFQNTVAATAPLSHGVAVTNTVPAGGLLTFAVNVPAWASFATNALLFATGPVNLLYNDFAPPTGTNDGSRTLLSASTGGTVVLSDASSPVLFPGTTYYLGVQNRTTTNISFALEVDFDIATLTNGIPDTAYTFDVGLPRYYQFEVSSNATGVAFSLANLTGNANLYVRKGAPLPTPFFHDYQSAFPGDSPELVLIFTNSAPVVLSPGRWYVGVFNADTVPVRYTVLAQEYTGPVPNFINLTNAISYAVSAPSAGPVTQYYRFDVPVGAARAQFELLGPSAPLTLSLQRGFPPLPGLTNYSYQASGTAGADVWITVFDSSSPVPLSPGPWFLAVVNTSGSAVPYSIKATAWGLEATNLVVTIKPSGPASFCLAWNALPGVRYVVEGTPELLPATWTSVSPVLLATNTAMSWCVPLPSPNHFFRVVEAAGSATPAAPVIPAPAIGGVTASTSGVTLRWTGKAGTRYRVLWSGTLSPANWTAFSGLVTSASSEFTFTDDGTQAGGLGGRRFYRVAVEP